MDNNIIAEQMNILITQYLEAFLSFCIKRTGNQDEAKDLAQEISYQCIKSIKSGRCFGDFNAYLWSIAHNTYKRWLNKKRNVIEYDDIDLLDVEITDYSNIEDEILHHEEVSKVREVIAHMSWLYRKILVSFYYDELSIRQISDKYNISEEMVKYYLQQGRNKFKEVYHMPIQYGEKSVRVSDFTLYVSTIDYLRVNVYYLFSRKLPQQIAYICYEKPRTVSELSIETRVPAIYIEDEIEKLIDGGVIISPVKDKFQTNIFIMKKNNWKLVDAALRKMYELYIPEVIKVFEKYLPKLINSTMFKQDVKESRYEWMMLPYLNMIYSSYLKHTDDDFPVILSCGERAFIYAEETERPAWGARMVPTYVEGGVVKPTDMIQLGTNHLNNLRYKRKSQALLDIYKGNTKDDDKETYVELIKEGYVSKKGDELYSEVAAIDRGVKFLFEEMNQELDGMLQEQTEAIYNIVYRIVKATIPEQLKNYSEHFARLNMFHHAKNLFGEMLHQRGMLCFPEEGDLTPITCYMEIDD